MNDTAVLDKNPISPASVGQAQPQAPVQPAQPVAPAAFDVAPVGITNKEMEPIPSVVPEIRRAGPEVKHEISQESTELGVKEIQDRPDLTEVVDMQHAGPSVPVPLSPTGLVKISEKKDTNVNNSKTWHDWLLEKVDKVMKLKLLGG